MGGDVAMLLLQLKAYRSHFGSQDTGFFAFFKKIRKLSFRMGMLCGDSLMVASGYTCSMQLNVFSGKVFA